MGGVWGITATGLFHFADEHGVFYMNGTGKTILGWQFIGIVAVIGWVVVLTSVLLLVLKMFKILRIDESTEVGGLDRAFHARKSGKFEYK